MLIRNEHAIVDTEQVDFYDMEIKDDLYEVRAVIRGKRVPLGFIKEEIDIDKVMNYICTNKYREKFFTFEMIKGVLEID
jgi:hypothetical protein